MRSEIDADAAKHAGPVAEAPRRPRLLSDQFRFWLSLLIAVVLDIILQFAIAFIGLTTGSLTLAELRSRAMSVNGYLATWVIFCFAFCLLTLIGFRKTTPTRLGVWLSESARKERRRRLLERSVGSGGPVAAVFLAASAFTFVIVVALHADLRTNPSVLVLAVLAVALSWVYIVVAYSTHYARAYANHRGLRFPRPDEETEPYAGPSMSDFFYLSAQVATTFSSSDVEVTSGRMRRVVTAHTLVMFTFNTVIVALLVSVLVSVAG